MSESGARRLLVTVEEVDSDSESLNGAINVHVRHAELYTDVMDAYLTLNGVSDSVNLGSICAVIQAELDKHLNSISLDISADVEVTMFTPSVQPFHNVLISEVGLRTATNVVTTAMLDSLYYCADVISTYLGVAGRYGQTAAEASEPKPAPAVAQKITPVMFNNTCSVVLAVASDSGEFYDTLDNIFLSKGVLLDLLAKDYPVAPAASVVRFDTSQLTNVHEDMPELDGELFLDKQELDVALRMYLSSQRSEFSHTDAYMKLQDVCSDGHVSLINYVVSGCDADFPSVDTVTQFIADMPQLTRVRNFDKCYHAIRRLAKKFGGKDQYCGFIVPTTSTVFGNFGPFIAELVQDDCFDPVCFAYSGEGGSMFVMHDKSVPEHIVNRACADSLTMDWAHNYRPETYTLVMLAVR